MDCNVEFPELWYLSEIGRAGWQNHSVRVYGLPPGQATRQGAVDELLVGEQVLEAGAEAGLVVVPLEAVLLGLPHLCLRSGPRKIEIVCACSVFRLAKSDDQKKLE